MHLKSSLSKPVIFLAKNLKNFQFQFKNIHLKVNISIQRQNLKNAQKSAVNCLKYSLQRTFMAPPTRIELITNP